jgi:hypothetical protein
MNNTTKEMDIADKYRIFYLTPVDCSFSWRTHRILSRVGYTVTHNRFKMKITPNIFSVYNGIKSIEEEKMENFEICAN